MTHRVLQILDALVPLVAAAPSIDGRVKRSRAFPFDTDDGVGVYVRVAEWSDVGETTTVQDADATINLELTAGSSADDIDAKLLAADAEIHAAIMADDSLGLPFVLWARRAGYVTDANAEGELATGSAVARWSFRFRHAENSME